MAEKVRCISPVGTWPTSSRLTPSPPAWTQSMAKTFAFSITGEPDITIALEKKTQEGLSLGELDRQEDRIRPCPVLLTEEEMKTTDAVILGRLLVKRCGMGAVALPGET